MESRRLGHWTAVMEMGREWVSAERNKSEGPSRESSLFRIHAYRRTVKTTV